MAKRKGGSQSKEEKTADERSEILELAERLPFSKIKRTVKTRESSESEAWMSNDDFIEYDGDPEEDEARMNASVAERLGIDENEMALLLGGPKKASVLSDVIAERFKINPALLKSEHNTLARLLESKRALNEEQANWLDMRMKGL